MGIEGEDFRGNPNRIEYTDDELIDDDDSDDGGTVMRVLPLANYLTGGTFEIDGFDPDFEVDDDDDDDEDDDDYGPDDTDLDLYVDFMSDEDSDDDLRVRMVNGHFVTSSPLEAVVENIEPDEQVTSNDIDNNEVPKNSPEGEATTQAEEELS